ncbi:MAG: hypothetical protein HOG89_00020 [Candidatus Peribacter sp.]|jgi:hypothetical protein|nr:hypothetical protein [Candidatus Peribacter sp.]MBT4392779.1 hypothetical protein [Candidatus Peribacter sp.]MBT4600604.1 hypothetical protein [Candidatus Peribacter sp.]MBT5148727.1 hypothetical protein [Candidatus Peribacter sp.]MBT5637678.1 hypothetical protein [Candidatus Peribacter sp.]
MNRVPIRPRRGAEQLSSAPPAGERAARSRRHATRGNLSLDHYNTTGNATSHGNACRNFEHMGDIANEKRSRTQMQDRMKIAFGVTEAGTGRGATTGLSSLPKIKGSIMMRKGADAQIYIDGKLVTISGPDELKRMQAIKKRLETTMRIINEKSDNLAAIAKTKRYTDKTSYVTPQGDTYELERAAIGTDIRWLTSPLRITSAEGSKVDPEREEIFRAYRDKLSYIKNTLTTPAAEHKYVTDHGNDDENLRCLERYCRDPNAIKGAGKFAALLAVGALLSFWVIRDTQKKNLSFTTLLLAGGAMFIMKGGPKNQFMASSQFADLSRRVGADGMKKLLNLPSGPRNHLIKTLNFYSGRGGITEENLHELTDPKSKSGKRLTGKRVPDKIARLFIGDPKPSGSAYVLGKMKGVRDPQSKKVMISLAEANSKSETAHKELSDMLDKAPPPAAPTE